MLFSPTLVYAIGGLAVLALVGTIVNDRLVASRKWVTRALLAAMIVFTIATFVLLFATARVVQLTPQLTLEHSLLFGSSTLRVGDREVELSSSMGKTIIVNHARGPARIETIQYGAAGIGPSAELHIAPGTIQAFDEKLDYLGPDHPPPDQISSKSAGETKHWLTW